MMAAGAARRESSDGRHADSNLLWFPGIPGPAGTSATGRALPARRGYALAKRTLDIVVALLGLTLLSPLLALIAVLIKLDSPGPAVYRAPRVGRYGRTFGMLKFRSMVDGADRLMNIGAHKVRGDSRVTPLGSILRKTSLDELPQLLNVLLGQMSLVGPRPELPEIVERFYEPWQYQRFLVPQGMTGWWQISGRGDRLMREHTEDDLYYIAHASFWFDLKILARTVRVALRMEGAF